VPSTSAANAGFSRVERVAWFRRVRDLRDRLRGPEVPTPRAPGRRSEAGEAFGQP
jgi:hypothetical protein